MRVREREGSPAKCSGQDRTGIPPLRVGTTALGIEGSL